jgi:hypothetical protein
MMHDKIAAAMIASGVVVVALTAFWFYSNWTRALAVNTTCLTRTSTPISISERPAEYWACVERSAELFVNRDYAEAKDLSKAFLTLLTAVFVASITFSEKIVDFTRSGRPSRAAMITCWVLLLTSIASCGAALAFIANAAYYASYYPQVAYREREYLAVKFLIVAGLAFGAAMITMLIAGVLSLMHGTRSAALIGPTSKS